MNGRIGDAVVDRFFRRPGGILSRLWWRDPRPHHASFRDSLRAANLGPDDRLLEIGCGGGTFLRWALESGCSAKAVDHSAEMVRLAVANNAAAVAEGRLEVCQASGEHLPFADGEFTCAAMMNVFFFLDAARVLGELRRVLATNGRLVIHTVAPGAPASVVPPALARRMHFYTDEEITGLLVGAGFGEVAVERRGKGRLQLVSARSDR